MRSLGTSQLNSEYPNVNRFLFEEVYKDIEGENMIFLINPGKYQFNHLYIYYKDGGKSKSEFTPLEELDNWVIILDGKLHNLSFTTDLHRTEKALKEYYVGN